MKNKFRLKIIHIGFDIGLLMKTVFASLEVISGTALIFLNPEKMSRLIILISKEELSEDPKDIIMNYLISFSRVFSINMQYFTMIYLLSHGIIKLSVIFLLWKKKLWAYPLSILVFAGFIGYQLYRYTKSRSIMLFLLTILDIMMIILTILEYKRIKNENIEKE